MRLASDYEKYATYVIIFSKWLSKWLHLIILIWLKKCFSALCKIMLYYQTYTKQKVLVPWKEVPLCLFFGEGSLVFWRMTIKKSSFTPLTNLSVHFLTHWSIQSRNECKIIHNIHFQLLRKMSKARSFWRKFLCNIVKTPYL